MLESGIRCTGEIVIAVLLRAHVRLSSPEVLAGISFKIYIYISRILPVVRFDLGQISKERSFSGGPDFNRVVCLAELQLVGFKGVL